MAIEFVFAWLMAMGVPAADGVHWQTVPTMYKSREECEYAIKQRPRVKGSKIEKAEYRCFYSEILWDPRLRVPPQV